MHNDNNVIDNLSFLLHASGLSVGCGHGDTASAGVERVRLHRAQLFTFTAVYRKQTFTSHRASFTRGSYRKPKVLNVLECS